MAAATEGFRKDSLSIATKHSMGVQFLKHTVDASVKLHQCRYTHRQLYFREVYPQLSSIRQWMHDLWEGKSKGQKGEDKDPETGHREGGSEAGLDVADWTTDEDEAEWQTRLQGATPLEQRTESSDEEIDWHQCDDIDKWREEGEPRHEQVSPGCPLPRGSWSTSPSPNGLFPSKV